MIKHVKWCIVLASIFLFQSSQSAEANDRRTVFAVQIFLNAHGYDVGEADGVAGPATRAALVAFSEDHSIEPTVMDFYSYALRQNLSQRVEIDDDGVLDMIREGVAANLRNPSSAQFRNIYSITGPSFADGDETYFCGQVNGHNAYGGYAGFQWFYGYSFGGLANNPIFMFGSIDGPDSDFAEMVCTLTFSR